MKAAAGVTEGDGSVTLGNSNDVTLGALIGPGREEALVRRTADPEGSADRALLLFLFAAGALLSPALLLWIAPGRPWWTLYAVWGLIIAVAALAQRRPP